MTPTASALIGQYGSARDATRATGGHEPDARLRRMGFRIASRPRDGSAVWERNGTLYTQREAEQQAARELKKVEQIR